MPLITKAEFENLPPWLAGPYKNLAERAAEISGEQFPVYPSERLAPIPEDVLKAQEMTREMMGSYKPSMEAARSQFETTTPFTEKYQEYMNPYQQSVVDQISRRGMRTFEEDVLPQLESKFVRLGQHGSARHADLARRAARDTQEEILDRQAQLMNTGYQQAAQIFSADQARAMEAARQLSSLAGTQQGMSMADIAALEAQGRSQQQQAQAEKDIAYENWVREKEYPSQALSFEGSVLHGIPTQGMRVATSQMPVAPQMNTMGNIGAIASNILAARMAAGK